MKNLKKNEKVLQNYPKPTLLFSTKLVLNTHILFSPTQLDQHQFVYSKINVILQNWNVEALNIKLYIYLYTFIYKCTHSAPPCSSLYSTHKIYVSQFF